MIETSFLLQTTKKFQKVDKKSLKKLYEFQKNVVEKSTELD